MNYLLTVGLEIHTQVNTKTKLYCSCSNDAFGKSANTLICPICTGQPGALPQLNAEAIKKAILLGHALNSDIQKESKFDRKSYFYPDNPAGYQITQYDHPILKGGYLEVLVNGEKKSFAINRIHIENDSGKLIHEGEETLVDLNRAGSPLFEIVTEPCFSNIEEVSLFFKELQKLLRYLKVSDADMEKGMMRADVNVSVRKNENDPFGTRNEIKNMNSFSEMEKAIAYEYERQSEVLRSGGEIEQENRGWDPKNKATFVQRTKENAADYRYFPEPDLPKLVLSESEISEAKEKLTELPLAKYERFMAEYQLPADDAFLLTETPEIANYYEETVKQCKEAKIAANWILSELLKYLKEDQIKINESKFTAEHLAELICLIKDGVISGKIAKDIFSEIYKTGTNPTVLVEEKGLKQNSNLGELEGVCKRVLENNAALVEQYKGGKDKLFGAFVGQVMKETKGQANPVLVNEILKNLLN